jgi:hypothetical protein
MMATVQVYQFAVVDLGDGRVVKAGSLSEPRCLSISDDAVVDETFIVAPETAVQVFDATAALGSFSFLWLESDLDVLVQFSTGTTRFDVKKLLGSGTAGVMGVAVVLGADDTLVAGTQDTFNGTAGTVEEIWVYNPDSTDTARVRVIAAA